MTAPPRRSVVLGGGIAGLVTSLELSAGGDEVTLVEAGPFCGGRVSSWETPSGLTAGTGLHVVADHYRHLLELMRELGTDSRLAWWERHHYYDAGGSELLFRLSRLPAPLHLLHPARAIPLPLADRWRLLKAGVSLLGARRRRSPELDRLTGLEWLRFHGLDHGFVLDLADFAAEATTFLPVERISAEVLTSWLGYMFRGPRSARVGSWRAPVGEVLIEPLLERIRARGGVVRTSTAAVRLLRSPGGRLTGVAVRRSTLDRPNYRGDGRTPVTGEEEVLPCDVVVSALPLQALRRLVEGEIATAAGLEPIFGLETVPALTLVLRFDRSLGLPRGALLVTGSPIRNAIDLTALRGGGGPSVVEVLVSLNGEPLPPDPEALVVRVAGDLARLAPGAAAAKLLDSHVEPIEAAMFAALPGAFGRRPSARTGLPNLFLAGDWTRHEWNASMEGAVVSGRRAAAAVREAGLAAPVASPEIDGQARLADVC